MNMKTKLMIHQKQLMTKQIMLYKNKIPPPSPIFIADQVDGTFLFPSADD